MKQRLNNLSRDQLLSIGYLLLFPGILLATILKKNIAMEIVGVVIILLSVMAFRLAYSAIDRSKK